jgi:hypothetical protein
VSTGAPLTSVLESLPSSISSQSEAKDVCVTLEVQLHIALEVVAQLDKAKDFRWLLPEKLSLREFLVEQISSLRMVFEVQDDAPFLDSSLHVFTSSVRRSGPCPSAFTA